VTRAEKAQREGLQREGALADHVRANPGTFSASSLARSYALPIARVEQIITRNGGSHAE
jgi:hypothetical protein